MSPAEKEAPARNAPCPCGSGKKYKRCCALSGEPQVGRRWPRAVTPIAVAAAAVLFGVLALSGGNPRQQEGSFMPGIGDTGAAQSTPDPWEYDEENDRHWDPSHSHWHDGPPPPGVLDAAAGSGETPEPWEYDAENNQHWDPEHNHWHGGPPPAEALQ